MKGFGFGNAGGWETPPRKGCETLPQGAVCVTSSGPDSKIIFQFI